MIPACLIALAARKSTSSTELFLQLDLDADEAFVELWGSGALIGYLCLARANNADEFRNGRTVATFELAGMLSARSPTPSPVVSLSGVLWRRQELLGVLSVSQSFDLPEHPTPSPWLQSAGGECPHEV